mgnify:CR=1 FL=1|tara:strand:- start:2187 stop:2747 length:561 start_codon:yes stop_codon:yes gene_type:complete
MKIVTLRVIPETEEVIYRDLIATSENTFLELHQLLLKAFEFTNDEMASFYISDEDWNKGQEITLFGMGNEEVLEMENTSIGSVFTSVNQKMLYTYDFLAMWNFSIEVMEVGEADEKAKYPKIGRRYGDAPDQKAKKIDGSDAESILVSAMFDDGDGDYDALFGDEDEDDLFNDDRFESLDDYDEYN